MAPRGFLVSGVLIAALTIACRQQPQPAWVLVWSDEFDAPHDSRPNPKLWTHELGGGGWGNRELQTYTDHFPENVVVRNGTLSIRAVRETVTGTDGITRSFTSARIHTRGRFALAYGRFEARIKVPRGKGLWPAFWMLGDDYLQAGWPNSGEIDIIDHIGSEPSTVHGALHGPGFPLAQGTSAAYKLPDGQQFADAFHLFAIEWQPGAVQFFVDDTLFSTMTPANLPAGGRWVFDHPFFLILNVAVGGDWPGDPDPSTVFPQAMEVDFVRVFRASTPHTN